jgi:GAF domain-containing protein
MAEQTPLSNTNNNAKLKIRIKQLSILHEIARAVTSILDLQSVLNRIVEAAIYLTDAEEGFLLMVDEKSQELHLRASKGLGDKAAKVMRVPVDDGLSWQVVRTGKPLRMGGKRDDDAYKVKTGYLVKSIVKVPIKGHDQVLGLLAVDHAIESFRTFSDQDVSLLTSLAAYAAVAIENAQRFEDVTRQVETLNQALKDAGVTPQRPTRDTDREALEKFNEGLRLQREEVAKAQREAQALAEELQAKAGAAQDIAHQLGLWNEQVGNLMPQLDWIAQTALAKKATGPLAETPDQDEVLSIVDILLKNLADGILLCNARGEILEASGSITKILNQPKEEIINKQLSDLFPNDAHWEHLVGSLRLAVTLEDKKTAPPPSSSVTFFEEDKVVQATLVPVNRHHNQGIAIITLLRDVSLETEGWRVRDETVNALSESLRTPLAAVHSYGDMLLNESVGLITSAQRRYLQRIRNGVDQMEEVLMNFTNLLKADMARIQTEQANLTTAFNDAIDAAREELTLAGVQLAVEIGQDLVPVQIAPEFFTRIMTDLLIKAGVHIKTGETLRLTTAVQREDDLPAYLVVTLSNQTPHPEIQPHLKDDPDLKTIAKAVQYQGSRIWIETDYQGQWKVSFLIPAAN